MFYFIIILLPLEAIIAQEIISRNLRAPQCPAMHYGASCRACNCTAYGTLTCDPGTGKCGCKQGFSGTQCLDIDECKPPDGDIRCLEKFEFCKNLRGTFQCRCKRGYRFVASGKCYPCIHGMSGTNCQKPCNCIKENTAGCLSETGACICKRGWEGPGCKTSVNDCAKMPCKDLPCLDSHKGHICVCGTGKRYVKGRCRDYSVQLTVLEQNPVYGQLMNVYILYSLSYPYMINPRANPDFVYEININGHFVCELSFHATHKRMKGREYILELLKTDRYHPFYSHFQMRRSEASFSNIKLLPAVGEYYEISRTLEECRSPDVSQCLKNMTISGTAPCLDHRLSCIRQQNIPAKLRQEYHKFKLEMNQGQNCPTKYKYIWTYKKIPEIMRTKPKMCLTYQDLDIVKLVEDSGEPSITDQHGEIEVVPKNTLPFGLIMLCAEVYADNNRANGVVACGVIRVTPSVNIIGRLFPPVKGTRYCPLQQNYRLRGDFKDPDKNIPIKYYWLRYTHRPTKYAPANWYKNRHITTYLTPRSGPSHVYYCERRMVQVFYVRVSARNKQKVFEFTVKGKDGVYYLRCHVSCGEMVGTDQTLVLTVIPSGRKRHTHGTWTFRSSSTNIATHSVRPGGDAMILRASGLTPNKEYTVQYKKTNKKIGAYGFKIPNVPQGQGCTISPSQGTAVVTEFQVECQNYKVEGSDLLRFHLYRKDSLIGKNKLFYTLIAYGGNPVMGGITLSKRGGGATETVNLKMKILSIYDSHTEVDLTVQLNDDSTTLNRVLTILTEPYLTSQRQENVRFINDVASLIYPQGATTMENKMQVRNELLRKLGNYRGRTAEWVMHTALALEKTTGQEDEMRPHGLTAGLKALSHLAEYLYKVGKNNIYTVEEVTRVLASAADRLIYKASIHGTDVVKKRVTLTGDRKKHLQQSKENSKNSVNSIKKITDGFFRSMIGHDNHKTEKYEHFEIGIESRFINKAKKFHFVTPNKATFYLPATAIGVGKSMEFVDSSYHFYEKNPYAFALEHIHGDLPLVYVDFARRGARARDFSVARSKAVKTSRFIRPADIILDFPSPAAERVPYEITVDVETQGNKQVVSKSSCLFLSVPISMLETTALVILSGSDLSMEVRMSYTNDLKAIDQGGNETAVELPLVQAYTTTVSSRTLTRDPHLVFLPKLTKSELKEEVKYYRLSISIKLGIQVDTTRLQLAPNQGNIRGSDSAQDGITAYLSNITVAPFRMACRYYDPQLEIFHGKKCYLSRFSSINHVHCQCVRTGAYTGSVQSLSSLVYPLNLDIFLPAIFKNPLAATLMVGTWMIFIALVRWARIYDKRDKESCKVTILEDNSDLHAYLYLVGVSTGWSASAATSSNVFIYLKGSWEQSKIHHLHDSSRYLFKRGAANWFILATSDDIGAIDSVVVWIDFSGSHPSWLLNNIVVRNLQTNESWSFQYHSWLSIGQLVAEIPVYRELRGAGCIMQIHKMMKNDMKNDHLWLGILQKTPTDRFTRVRRLATAQTTINALMLLNLMFFRIMYVDVTSKDRQHLTFLGQRIHLSSILISLKSAGIISLLDILLSFILSRTQHKTVPQSSIHFTEEQLDMMMRQEGMNSRKQHGLLHLYPLLTKADVESTVTAETLETDLDEEITISVPVPEDHNQDHNQNNESERGGEENEQLLTTVGQKAKNFMKNVLIKEEVQAENKPEKEVKDKDKNEVLKMKQGQGARKRFQSATFLFPWWSIYLTFIPVILLNGMFAYYITTHGLRLMPQESLEWLLCCFLGLILCVLVIMPAVVFLNAAVKVLVLRRKPTTIEEGPISSLAEGLMLLLKYRLRKNAGGPVKRRRSPAHNMFGGGEGRDAYNVLARLRVESEAGEMLRDLLLYTLFMATILITINGHLNVNMEHEQMVSVEHELLGLEDQGDNNLLSEINAVDDMWKYLIDVVAVRLVPEIDYNKKDISRNFLLMAHARLRQIRATVNDTDCLKGIPPEVWPRDGTHTCLQFLSGAVPEENRNFNESWDTTATDLDDTVEDSPYRYYSAEELRASVFIGEHGIYSGGGYVQTFLREDPTLVQGVLKQLSSEDWVDKYTRCVFLEFTVYNSGVDMFSQVIIAFEIDIYGGVFAYESISTANISLTDRENKKWFKIFEIIAGICLILSLFGSIIRFSHEGLRVFFSNFWNWIEVLFILLTILAVVFYMLRQNNFMVLMQEFNAYGHSYFFDFNRVFFWQMAFHITMGFSGALAILKMLKVTRFNPFWKTFTRSVVIGLDDFKAFMFATTFIILAYCSLGRLVFGSHAKSYSSFSRSLNTLLFFILGEPDFFVIINVNLVMGRFFFLTFMFISQYLVVFIFIAILRDALDIARYMDYRHELAVSRYIADTILLYFNSFIPQILSSVEEREML